MEVIRKIAHNSSIIIGGRILDRFINLLIAISLAKYFGQSGFGKLSLLGIYFFFLGSMDQLWIRPILIREMSRDKTNAQRLIGNGLLIRLLLSSAAVIFFWVTLWLIQCPPDVLQLAFFVSWGLLLTSLGSSYEMIFRVNLKMIYFEGFSFLSNIITLAIVYLIIFFKGTLYHFYIIGLFLGILLLLGMKQYAEKLIKPKFSFDAKLWRKIFRESWPLGLTAICIFIYHRIDQAMLFRMIGSDAVGSYSAAVRLVECFNIIPVALVASTLPLMSKYFDESKDLFIKTYQLSFKYLIIFIVPVAVLATIFSQQIIVLFYGKQFLSSSPVLSLLIWAEIFVFMGVVNNAILVAAHKQIVDPLFTGVSALINIVLNFLLIPHYGFIGAAIATLIAYPLGPLMGYFLQSTKTYSRCMFTFLIRPLCASLLMAGCIALFRFPFVIALIIMPFVYIGLLYLVKGIDYSDLQRVKSIMVHHSVKY